MPKKCLLLAAVLVAGVLTLTACGSDNDNGDSDSHMPGMGSSGSMMSPTDGMSSEFNDADVTFATDMISHHRQAVEMARTEQADGTNPDAQALAEQIENAQTAEITMMRGMLR